MADEKNRNPDRRPDQDTTGGNGETDRQIRAYQRQLRRLTSELSLTEARERREIASDLHDHIGQALAYVSQKVSILRGDTIFSGMEDDFSEILSILDQTIRYTRELTVAISPPVLYELGLSAAIDWLAERARFRHELKVKSYQSGTPKKGTEDIEVFIFKALQELITNVAKHAGAKRVTVQTNWNDDHIEIVVRDDGCGFDTSGFESGLSDDCCFGLFSIRERLSYIGGSIRIESTPGKGTHVTLVTPYQTSGGGLND
ncbi:MAG: sensor histidine kinase [Candidatus Zixiibacteriota bacterium]